MKKTFIAAAAAALSLAASMAQATVIESAYTALGGDAWLVDLRIVNDGMPASFAGFTIDIADATDLAVVASPLTWSSMVFQPDTALQVPGAFDSFVINEADALGNGQSLGGFRFSFRYAAGATPGALPYLLSDASFTPVYAGMTTVTAVPEPATVLLTAMGLGLVALRATRQRQATRRTEESVA